MVYRDLRLDLNEFKKHFKQVEEFQSALFFRDSNQNKFTNQFFFEEEGRIKITIQNGKLLEQNIFDLPQEYETKSSILFLRENDLDLEEIKKSFDWLKKRNIYGYRYNFPYHCYQPHLFYEDKSIEHFISDVDFFLTIIKDSEVEVCMKERFTILAKKDGVWLYSKN